MLVDYSVTEMGCFDIYSDAAPCDKSIRGDGNNTFPLYVVQCITLDKYFGYRNTYCQGKVEVIIFKVRFKSY